MRLLKNLFFGALPALSHFSEADIIPSKGLLNNYLWSNGGGSHAYQALAQRTRKHLIYDQLFADLTNRSADFTLRSSYFYIRTTQA